MNAFVCGDKTSVMDLTYNAVISRLHWNQNERLALGFYFTSFVWGGGGGGRD